MLNDQQREEVFRPICDEMFFAINGLYRYLNNRSDFVNYHWEIKSEASMNLSTLYLIASHRFIDSKDKAYDKYLVKNSSKEDRAKWVEFINGGASFKDNGPFNDYIEGNCEIDESFDKILNALSEQSKADYEVENKKRKSDIAKTYHRINWIAYMLSDYETYSDKKLSELTTELNEIIEKQDQNSLIGSFIGFYCAEIQKAYDTRDVEKLKEIAEDWKRQRDYIWSKIPE